MRVTLTMLFALTLLCFGLFTAAVMFPEQSVINMLMLGERIDVALPTLPMWYQLAAAAGVIIFTALLLACALFTDQMRRMNKDELNVYVKVTGIARLDAEKVVKKGTILTKDLAKAKSEIDQFTKCFTSLEQQLAHDLEEIVAKEPAVMSGFVEKVQEAERRNAEYQRTLTSLMEKRSAMQERSSEVLEDLKGLQDKISTFTSDDGLVQKVDELSAGVQKAKNEVDKIAALPNNLDELQQTLEYTQKKLVSFDCEGGLIATVRAVNDLAERVKDHLRAAEAILGRDPAARIDEMVQSMDAYRRRIEEYDLASKRLIGINAESAHLIDRLNASEERNGKNHAAVTSSS